MTLEEALQKHLSEFKFSLENDSWRDTCFPDPIHFELFGFKLRLRCWTGMKFKNGVKNRGYRHIEFTIDAPPPVGYALLGEHTRNYHDMDALGIEELKGEIKNCLEHKKLI